MKTDTIVTYSAKDSNTDGYGTIWLNMEQEYIPKATEQASIADLNNMLAAVRRGESAYKYIMENCNYVIVEETEVVVSLKFFVWPSSLDLPYTLRADLGEITEGESVEVPRKFDIIFDNTDEVALGWIFEGTTSADMPFFLSDGSEISVKNVQFDSGIAKISTPGYCVYRADGDSIGYEHELILRFDKVDEEGNVLSIVDLKVSVFAEWEDINGELQVTTLDIEIPQCVEDALKVCEDGLAQDVICWNCGDPETLNVYFDTCTGEVLDYWFPKK